MKFDLENDFLPVGSIVSLRFNRNKFMIMGYGTIDGETKEVYDYVAVQYPVGLISLDNVVMVNRPFVKKIYHTGYVSEEYNNFSKAVKEAMEKRKNTPEKEESN